MTGLTAHDDAYVIISGQPSLSPTFYGVLTNDASASLATATLLSSTTHGSLQLSSNGTFTYIPNMGFAGIDTFNTRQAFDIGHGDQLDITQVLAGADLLRDLSNISDFVKLVGYGANDPGFAAGTKATLEIVRPNGSATIALEGSGRFTVDELVKSNSLLLPPSRDPY